MTHLDDTIAAINQAAKTKNVVAIHTGLLTIIALNTARTVDLLKAIQANLPAAQP